MTTDGRTGKKTPDLLWALLQLTQYAEGRRRDIDLLMVSIDRLLFVLLRMLRVGEDVMVNDIRYVVEYRNGEKCLVVNGGVLGMRNEPGLQLASLKDNEVFARDSALVVQEYARWAQKHAKRLHRAAQAVRETEKRCEDTVTRQDAAEEEGSEGATDPTTDPTPGPSAGPRPAVERESSRHR